MKRIVTVALTMMLVASTLVAQGSSESSSQKSKTQEKQKVVIDLYRFGQDNPEMVAAVEKVSKMDKYKNVEFELLPYDSEYRTTLPIALSAGEQRDIICIKSADWLTNWANSDIIIPLDEYAKTAGVDYDKTYGLDAADAMVNNQIFAIPTFVNQWCLFYNKSIFDKAGVEYPDSKVPMTWEEYNELAKKLTMGSGSTKTYGALEINWGQFWYGEAIIKNGGTASFYTADGLKSNIEDPSFAKSMQNRYNRMFVDKSTPTYADVATSKTAASAFMNGNYGIFLDGGWVLDWLAEKDKYPRDWKAGIAPMPVDEGTTLKTWGSENYLCIPQTSANPQLAFEIAMDIEEITCESCSLVNANKLIEQPSQFVRDAKVLVDDDISLSDIKYLFSNPKVHRYPEKIVGKGSTDYIAVIDEETELYFVQEQTLEQTIKNIKTRGDKAIAEAEK